MLNPEQYLLGLPKPDLTLKDVCGMKCETEMYA